MRRATRQLTRSSSRCNARLGERRLARGGRRPTATREPKAIPEGLGLANAGTFPRTGSLQSRARSPAESQAPSERTSPKGPPTWCSASPSAGCSASPVGQKRSKQPLIAKRPRSSTQFVAYQGTEVCVLQVFSSRRPDSNRGPLHYERKSSEGPAGTRGYKRARSRQKLSGSSVSARHAPTCPCQT
jgi:hypothetical protein